MEQVLEGGCLCGAVRYRVTGPAAITGHCFCNDCRKTSGTSHATIAAFPAAALTVDGTLKRYARPADSGNVVTRSFCPECGSQIISENAAMAGMVFLKASSLDDPEVLTPQMTVYAARAPSWALIDHSHPVHDTMPAAMPEAVSSDS